MISRTWMDVILVILLCSWKGGAAPERGVRTGRNRLNDAAQFVLKNDDAGWDERWKHGCGRKCQGHERHRHKDINLRPLIGVLSQGGSPAPEGYSYIASSYIKFIAAAGARAVPILHDMERDEVIARFNAVNGIILPGGSQKLQPGEKYYDTASLIFNLTIEANNAGDYFPLHGTCTEEPVVLCPSGLFGFQPFG